MADREGGTLSIENALPCPFCGQFPTIEPWHGGGPNKHMVHCEEPMCHASPGVTGQTKRKAIENWNQRAPTTVASATRRIEPLTDDQIMNAAIKAADALDATRVSEMRAGGWHATTIFDGDTGLIRFGRLVEQALGIASAKAESTK